MELHYHVLLHVTTLEFHRWKRIPSNLRQQRKSFWQVEDDARVISCKRLERLISPICPWLKLLGIATVSQTGLLFLLDRSTSPWSQWASAGWNSSSHGHVYQKMSPQSAREVNGWEVNNFNSVWPSLIVVMRRVWIGGHVSFHPVAIQAIAALSTRGATVSRYS